MKTARAACTLLALIYIMGADLGIQFCLEYRSKILKNGWTGEGQWPEPLRNMQAR